MQIKALWQKNLRADKIFFQFQGKFTRGCCGRNCPFALQTSVHLIIQDWAHHFAKAKQKKKRSASLEKRVWLSQKGKVMSERSKKKVQNTSGYERSEKSELSIALRFYTGKQRNQRSSKQSLCRYWKLVHRHLLLLRLLMFYLFLRFKLALCVIINKEWN